MGAEIPSTGTEQHECCPGIQIEKLALPAWCLRHREIVFDSSKPDGTPRKLLDVSRLHALGWTAKKGLREGIEETYQWYLANKGRSRLTSDPSGMTAVHH